MSHHVNGLRNVLAGAHLGGIEAPPEREGFASDEEYERAYVDWQGRMTFWRSSVQELPISDSSDA